MTCLRRRFSASSALSWGCSAKLHHGGNSMPALRLPQEVESVLREFFTCEFTTVNRRAQPLTWPTLPYFHQPEGQIIVAASIAFPVKALNARRHPQVSLLY